MQLTRKMLMVLRLALTGLAPTFGGWAAEQAESPVNWANPLTNGPAMKAEAKYEVSPGMRPVTRAYISSGSYRFGVEIPEGYRLQRSVPDQVTFTAMDLTASVGFRIAGTATEDAVGLKPEYFRSFVFERFPGAKILEEFVMPAALGKMGLAFDIQVNGSGGMSRKGRITFVPIDAGILEFSTVASQERFKTALADFHTLVLTFRASDANGKLEMPVLPSKI